MIISKKQILSIGLITTASLIFGSSCQQNSKTKETDSTTDSLPEKQVDSNTTELKLDTAWKDFVGIDKSFPDKRIVDCRYCL